MNGEQKNAETSVELGNCHVAAAHDEVLASLVAS
jgi:hypothetical protein